MKAHKNKSRLLAAALSGLACPGIGQIYKGHRLRGILLVIASLLLVTAMVVKVWIALFEMSLSVAPQDMLSDMFGMAHSVMSHEAGFLRIAGYSFMALWTYGVLDALIARVDE